jgi:superoxide reductase
MAKRLDVYRCNICGHIIEVLHEGVGTLVCCDEPMEHLTENTVDAAQEKHVPVVEKTDAGYIVTVGSVEHPMTEQHHIEWIELIADGKAYREFLKPGTKPQATFAVEAVEVSAREYCNLHGLWKG